MGGAVVTVTGRESTDDIVYRQPATLTEHKVRVDGRNPHAAPHNLCPDPELEERGLRGAAEHRGQVEIHLMASVVHVERTAVSLPAPLYRFRGKP